MAGIRVSVRDLNVLHDLYKSVFLSFYQIKEGHFEKQARPTVYNRLSKLSQAGLLKSFSVNLQAHHRRHEDVGVLYKITKQGISVLKTYLPHLVLKMEPAPINMSALSHDLMLTDVLRKLEKGFPERKLWNSKVESKANGPMSKLPDGVMKSPTSNEEIAIELELTPKSEKRYRDIVLSYQMDSRFSRVFYIVSGDQMRQKIGGVITGFGDKYGPKDATGKFYFCTKDQLFSSIERPSFDNGAEVFCSHPSLGMYKKEVI